jgi:CelD/BcsL family acetyltransferase involved in cellulose biosynthesis
VSDEAEEIGLITTCAEFDAMADEWSALLKLHPCTDPFIDHLWLRNWFKAWFPDVQPFVLVVRQNERLVAAAPLAIRTEQRWRCRWRVLQLATLSSSGPVRSDFLLGEPQLAEHRLDLLLAAIGQRRAHWDVAEFDGLPEEGMVRRRLDAGCLDSPWLRIRQLPSRRSRLLVAPPDWPKYVRSRSKHLERNMRQERNRLNKLGQWSLSTVNVAEDLEFGLKTVRGILCERYNVNDLSTLSAVDRRAIDLFETACRQFAARNALDFRLLCVNDNAVACLVSLLLGQMAYPLLTKYSPSAEWASPGRALIAWLCEQAGEEGWTGIDFLSDWDYLQRLTDEVRTFVGVNAWHTGWRSRLHDLLWRRDLRQKRLSPKLARDLLSNW